MKFIINLFQFLKIEINGNGIKKFINILYNPIFNSIFLIRLQMCTKNILIKKLIQKKLSIKYGIYISSKSIIGIGLKLPHPNGIIIGNTVRIGNNCTIFQQVTIGSRDVFNNIEQQPIIGNDCIICAGAKVIGTIVVADKTTIGANAVLTHSTEIGGIYIGVPAKKRNI